MIKKVSLMLVILMLIFCICLNCLYVVNIAYAEDINGRIVDEINLQEIEKLPFGLKSFHGFTIDDSGDVAGAVFMADDRVELFNQSDMIFYVAYYNNGITKYYSFTHIRNNYMGAKITKDGVLLLDINGIGLLAVSPSEARVISENSASQDDLPKFDYLFEFMTNDDVFYNLNKTNIVDIPTKKQNGKTEILYFKLTRGFYIPILVATGFIITGILIVKKCKQRNILKKTNDKEQNSKS